jgi:hypothetical protein
MSVAMKNVVFWKLGRVALVETDVSEKRIALIIRVTIIGELGTTLSVTSNRGTLRRNTRSVRRLLVTANVPSSPIPVTLMMEAVRSSELSVLTRVTLRNSPEDDIRHLTGVFAITCCRGAPWGSLLGNLGVCWGEHCIHLLVFGDTVGQPYSARVLYHAQSFPLEASAKNWSREFWPWRRKPEVGRKACPRRVKNECDLYLLSVNDICGRLWFMAGECNNEWE